MKPREIKIQRQKFNVEKKTSVGDTRTFHRCTRSSHCKQDQVIGFPHTSGFHFAQPEISLNFKLPVIHSV